MGNLFYFVAFVLVLLWAVGYFGLHAGNLVHLLVVLAIVVVLLGLLQRRPL